MHALVIGAGIGGATTAIALARVGVGATVCERAPQPREVGAGIALGANAMMALRAIGAVEPIYVHADCVTAVDLLNPRGRLMVHTPVAELERDLEDRSVVIHRADLLDALLSQVAPGVVRFGCACTGLAEDGSGVTARFADGTTARADLLIGADGIRSVVRAGVLGEAPVRYSGYTGWRGVTPGVMHLVPGGRGCEYWGRGARFGFARCGRDRVYWYAAQNAPPEGRDEPDPRPALLRLFAEWASPVPELIEATPAQGVLRNDIIDRPPSRKWGGGRITLLGDAAHATTPNLGQGACMAIEDAVVLARHLRDVQPTEIPDALRAYERARMRRTAMITRTSWRIGRVGQWESPVACGLRDAVVSRTPSFVVRSQTRQLTGYRVTL